MNPYESQALLDQYLLFHYGTAEEIAPPPGVPGEALLFPVHSAELALAGNRDAGVEPRALDIGCAVGRSAFELSKSCDEVIAIDYSRAFITAAEKIKTDGSLNYHRLDEGRHTSALTARLPAQARPENVLFEKGDAMKLDDEVRAFDLVHAANLLCRLSNPKKFLQRLPELVGAGGRLVLTTPCTWSREFTPKRRWPKKSTLEYLEKNLGKHFQLEETRDLPFLIREHARKFQLSTAQATVWIRNTAT